jgi:acyl-CoA thioesterase-1
VRSALVFHLLSGHAWFSAGIVILALLAAELAGALAPRPALLRTSRIVFLLAVGVAGLSGTPVPLWLLAPLGLALAGVIATAFRPARSRPGRIAASAALVLVLAALLLELPRHRPPRVPLPAGTTLLVLGDSLSSGGFDETAPWPALLAGTGAPVRNLALPGDTVRSAMRYQIPRLAPVESPNAVLIELGGNDLLGGTPVARYEADLDALLAQVRRAGAEAIVLFELPLPPGRWRWGAVQRRLAAKHGAVLIPKRVLARVVSTPRLVDDGLHPTDAGHELLAREVAGVIRPSS